MDVRTYLPNWARAWLGRRWRGVTAGHRTLPDWVVIGGMRCGSTSLYMQMTKHPDIWGASVKEVHYFDFNYDEGLDSYRFHFPLRHSKRLHEAVEDRRPVVGEGSPYYIYHPVVPERVADVLPEVKLIAVLRNPTERAISHYFHQVRNDMEGLSLEEALEAEGDRLPDRPEETLAEPGAYHFGHHHHSYLQRGKYVEQLRRWREYFPADQMLVLKSENFFREPGATIEHICEFLGVRRWSPQQEERRGSQGYSSVSDETRERLDDYFAPYNRELYEFLGRDFGW